MEDTDFNLAEHHKERINFHKKMLLYYLKEEQNDRLATKLGA
jgi:hypothetical protein